ncbi:aldehyde dehydrogenase [Pseudooceanicola algae]|uniref:Aldehyde dehydrogenase AldA n=1 Tax=Pseudooceanicola algae TaxID=1537215 RepID=A0A418SJZ8_9RHOB|nr:aldehyde dehydrogenase [Pseudooceanicola algae]QPM92228.1 Putative aldehyde dehydrogenase AldA [Pseudooceanicola algae]
MKDLTTELPDGRLFIGGEWETGTGAEITSTYPHDGSFNLSFKGASRADGEKAIARAKAAQADPAWANLLPHERARMLHAIADGIEANIERISYVQSRDTGKTRGETRALAGSAVGTFRYFAAVLETSDDDLTVQRATALTASIHEPIGVVAAITPWNSPIASDAQKVAPALAAGNAVIIKPSSWSPMVSLVLAEICEEVGLPKGLLSVLPGAGREIGNLLVEHCDIGRVAFTGGTVTGRRLAAQAGEKLMPVSLELGGKSPTIVFEDHDRDLTIAGILFGIFSSSGQSCIAGSRLFVQKAIYDDFLADLVKATEKLVVGAPDDPATQVAPMICAEHRDSVEKYIALAQEEGGKVLCGGTRPEGEAFAKGSYLKPTIIAGLTNDAQVCREEIFGPVLVVLPFEDEAEVIAQSNDNDYGLACGIWTKDFPRAWRLARAIKAGTVWINTYKQFSISTPFGGDGASGMGREKGREGLRAWQRQKGIYADLTGNPHPWARVGQ